MKERLFFFGEMRCVSTRSIFLRHVSRRFYHEDTMMILRNNQKEVFVVGTAHVSKISAQQVRDVIENVRPDSVVVELCEERLKKLRKKMQGSTTSSNTPPANLEQVMQLVKGVLPGGNLFKTVITVLYKLFERQGFDSGGEFRAAIEECDRRGIPLICGDQDQQVTLAKMKDAFSLQDLARMLTSPTAAAHVKPEDLNVFEGKSTEDIVESMKTRRHVSKLMGISRSAFPKVIEKLVDERDVILCDSILSAPGKRVVAVVGMAHMDGIQKNWNKKT